MPTVLSKYGYRFHFYSSDGNEPPHIHVTGHGRRAKIWIDELVVAKSYKFNNTEIIRVLTTVEENKDTILEAWNDYFG